MPEVQTIKKEGEVMRTNLKIAMQRILDMASGADTSYVPLRWMLEEMDKRAAAGDKEAQKVIDIVIHFARLIDVAESTKL